MTPPDIKTIPSIPLGLKANIDAVESDPEAELLLFDGQPDIQRKMKKAFCEPGNISHCPPLAIAAEFVLPYSNEHTLTVARKEENGGKLSFDTAANLTASFAEGNLHPGDLKPAVRDAADSVLKRVRDAVQSDCDLSKALKEMEKVTKRMNAKKK